jgi:hypothetical protein
VPHVFIVDADALQGRGPDKRSTLIQDIMDLHAFLVHGDLTPSEFAVLKPYRVTASGEAASPVLGQLIGVEGNQALAQLANAFLSDDEHEWGNDWTIELSKGMMANPKVGSIALAHKVESIAADAGGDAKAERSRQFGRLFDVLRPGTRVAIAGSNFGGTGSGVIPALVRQLDGEVDVEAVRAFMCMPWFSIEAGNERSGRNSAARDRDGMDPQERNSSLGLHTYFGELTGRGAGGAPLARSTYVLAQSMPHWPRARRVDDGNFDQRENRHMLNLVQATAIQAFLGLGKGGAPNGSLYSIKMAAPDEKVGRFDAGVSPHLRFRAGADDSRQVVDLVADAEATAFVLEKAGRVMQSAKDGNLQLNGIANLNNIAGIDRFVTAVSQSLGKGTVKHSRMMGIMGHRECAPDEVYKGFGTALIELAHQLRASLVWLDGHSVARAGADESQAAGMTGVGTTHLFGAAEFGNPLQRFADIDANASLVAPWKALGLRVSSLSGEDMASSPPISQAVQLFIDVFARTDGAQGTGSVEALLGEFSEQRKAASHDAGTTVAARVIGKAIHKRVVAARAQVRRKESVLDARQASSDFAGEPMLSLDGLVGRAIEDCRLAEVDLNQDTVGKVEPFSARHPMSLAYIEPYGGLKLGNGGQITLADHVFAEHGLRGIPNIAAPQLLQKWRLQKCRPQTDEERAEPMFVDRDGRIRATKAGIYLHARRIEEAALWLIVSADPRAEFVADLFNEANRRLPFARLVRRELGLREDQQLPALVFAERGADHGKPIFLWSGETWFLAANAAARRFFAALVAELPSVRHRYRTDNPLVRVAGANTAAAKPLDRFFARQLASAVEALRPAAAQAQGSEPAAALREALIDILAELPDPTDRDIEAFKSDGHTLWLRSASHAGAGITVAPHRMVAELQSYICKPVVVFVDKDQQHNGILPITAEAWQMLEGAPGDNRLVLAPSGAPKVDDRSLAVRKVQRIQLQVRGLGTLEQEFPFGNDPLPVIQHELAWSFGIWPKFRAEGWNYYVISGTSRVGDPDREPERKNKTWRVNVDWMSEAHPVALVVKGHRPGDAPGDALRELGRVMHGLPRRIHGVPEVLELMVGNRVLGSCRIDLDRVDLARSIDMIGVDFGTSNTCIAVRESEADPASSRAVPLLPGGSYGDQRIGPLLHYLDSRNDANAHREFLCYCAGFFHAKNAEVAGDAGDTVPSELIASLDDTPATAARQKPLLARIYDRDDKPYGIEGTDRPIMLGDYPIASPLLTVLPPQPYGLDEDEVFFAWLRGMVRSGDQRLIGDLKWPRPSDDQDNFLQSRSVRAAYLEHVIVTALAVLRSCGIAGFGKFVATQPEALSQVKPFFAETFATDLQAVVGALSQRTGMKWHKRASVVDPQAKRDVLLVSETVAALHMSNYSSKQSPVSVLTIDVGGGTTDVGVRLRYGRSGRTEQRHTSSARFAGNKLLESLAQSRPIREFFKSTSANGDYSVEALKSLLKSELRRKTGMRVRTEQTGRLADMFFDGVYEYAFRLLHLFKEVNPGWADQFLDDPDQKLRIVLLGNGFKLYEACQAAGSGETLAAYHKRLLERLVGASLLPQEFVSKGKVAFDLPATTKSGLIKEGGLDAAFLEGTYREDERTVLLPKGLASRDPEGARKVQEQPALLSLNDFREQWVGMFKGQSQARNELSLELTDKAMKEQFPLTYAYWRNGRVDRTDDLQNVFQTARVVTPLYLDVGALYLTGAPIAGGKSYAWLMTQYATDGS